MRFFTLCSYLITKESYNWWIKRREWGFRHQISGNTQEDFAGVQDGCEISQPKGHHFSAKG